MIQSISNQKFIRCIETNKFRIVLETAGDSFVEQSAYLKRSRLALLQYSHETIQSAARINDVLDQQNVPAFQLSFGVEDQLHGTARHHPIPITRRHQEIDLQRTSYLSHQIAEEDEASFEQAEHQQIAVGISGSDLPPQLGNSARQSRLVESDALDGAAGKARIFFGGGRLDVVHALASGWPERI